MYTHVIGYDEAACKKKSSQSKGSLQVAQYVPYNQQIHHDNYGRKATYSGVQRNNLTGRKNVTSAINTNKVVGIGSNQANHQCTEDKEQSAEMEKLSKNLRPWRISKERKRCEKINRMAEDIMAKEAMKIIEEAYQKVFEAAEIVEGDKEVAMNTREVENNLQNEEELPNTRDRD